MSCCDRTTPGTPTLSSGYTAMKAANAIRADQAQILLRLQGRVGSDQSCPGPVSNKVAMYASVLEQDHATRCQPSQAVQALTFPKRASTESVRIQKTMTDAILCGGVNNSLYRRFVPQAACPPPTAEQLNSTAPKPTFAPGCTPSRFF
jgi:hypothetical protein